MSSALDKAGILNIWGQFKRLIQIWDELRKADNLIIESREEANAITLEMANFKEKVMKIGEQLLKEKNIRQNAIEFRHELKQRSFVKNMNDLLHEINECKRLYKQLYDRIGLIKFKIDEKIITLNELSKEMEHKASSNFEVFKFLDLILFTFADLTFLSKILLIFSGIFGALGSVYAFFRYMLTKPRIDKIAVEFAMLQKLDQLLRHAYGEIEILDSSFDQLYNCPNVSRNETFYDNLFNRMITFHTGYQLSVVN